MAAPALTNADLDEMDARRDSADIPRLLAALRAARAELAQPLRIDAAWPTLMTYLRRIDLLHVGDSLVGTFTAQTVEDCRIVALKLGFIREARTGRLDLTKRGAGVLPDSTKNR
jgi:hypothetical protein